MEAAAVELASLEVDGLQLTPGCAPTEGFDDWVDQCGLAIRTHQGFSFRALRSQVWGPGGELLVASDSVHPPRPGNTDIDAWWEVLEAHGLSCCLEVMYPPHPMGRGRDLERAMDAGLGLAVDVSHLHIQRTQGALSDATLARLLNYERVEEIHVSGNNGHRDQHRPLVAGDFGLGWARERSGDIPVVLESYLHALDSQAREDMIEMVLA
ncbi:MAG: hypothetical protein GY925_01750 [Actinomycetia bacterium]|nr:hypothetical protein [Actinomycetes bacterium]